MDTAIGSPSKWKYSDSMDAAFVPFNSGFSPSIAINGDADNKIKNYVKVADIEENMSVAKFGSVTGRTTGTITNKSVTCYNSNTGVTLTRLIETSCNVVQGDSGGPLYLSSAQNGYAKNSVVGILNSKSSTHSYWTKAGFILATFNLELYTGQ